MNKEAIFGTVIACDDNNNLTVQLNNGETGVVAADEIGRRAATETTNYAWMQGRCFGFIAGEVDGEGRRILSGKAYENGLYEEIVRAFQAKERNVYTARLASVTRDGKLAFYTLAQGVNASLTVSDFAFTRIRSFQDVALPREMTVAIKDVDKLGRLRIYGKLAFGDFASSVDRLSLDVGSEVEGLVTGVAQTTGEAIVSLAPNLTVLTDRAPMDSWVRLRITRLHREDRRLKGEIIGDCGDAYRHFAFDRWCVGAGEYPAYVDVDDFEGRIGPRKVEPAAPAAAAPEETELSYELHATMSPFSLRDNEVAVRTPLNGGTAKRILFESQHGYLNENHLMVARAVNDLKYTTSWQVQRYLHLKHGVVLSERSLWSILNRLIKLDILHTLRLGLNGQFSSLRILYPGAQLYSVYTGSMRYLPTYAYSAEPDPALVKCHLSANQLLLGVMRSRSDIHEIENRVYIVDDGGTRIRPRHRLTTEDGEAIYIESARGNWQEDMLGKLGRYETHFKSTGERARVIITLEDAGAVEAFAGQVAELRLGFEVDVTSDLQCLPEPVLRTIPAHAREGREGGLFSRIRSFFEESMSA